MQPPLAGRVVLLAVNMLAIVVRRATTPILIADACNVYCVHVIAIARPITTITAIATSYNNLIVTLQANINTHTMHTQHISAAVASTASAARKRYGALVFD